MIVVYEHEISKMLLFSQSIKRLMWKIYCILIFEIDVFEPHFYFIKFIDTSKHFSLLEVFFYLFARIFFILFPIPTFKYFWNFFIVV